MGSAEYMRGVGAPSWTKTVTGTSSTWNSGFINIVPEPGSTVALVAGPGSVAGLAARKHQAKLLTDAMRGRTNAAA